MYIKHSGTWYIQDMPSTLQWLVGTVVSNEICNFGTFYDPGPDRLCFKASGSLQGICIGDAGGPLTCLDDKNNAVITGIASYLHSSQYYILKNINFVIF